MLASGAGPFAGRTARGAGGDDRRAHHRDGRTVPEDVRPSTPDELKDLIARAADDEVPLEILGAGTKRGFGRPVEAGRVLRLGRLAGISLYEPEELVMSARAGTRLADIEARLAEHQQQLAFEPPDYGELLGGASGQGTIGGVFACNLSGPRRIKAGAARDHLLGVQAVTGRGELIKSGGRVVKNVTGYDLCKLLTGSFGSLAAMSEVTFKVLPAPPETCSLLLAGLAREQAFAALRRALGSAYDVAGAAYLPAGAAARSAVAPVAAAAAGLAVVRLEGLALDVAPSLFLWREIREGGLVPDDLTLWRVSTAPTAGPALIEELERQLELAWLADWAGGLLWLAVPGAEAGGPEDGGAAAIRGALAGPRGHATLVRGSRALRASVPVFQPQEAALARLTARVKDSFDPKRILNPGRMYADF
jgi:glycolate oxidase FAD binding subunit